jgi:hypothetical protein
MELQLFKNYLLKGVNDYLFIQICSHIWVKCTRYLHLRPLTKSDFRQIPCNESHSSHKGIYMKWCRDFFHFYPFRKRLVEKTRTHVYCTSASFLKMDTMKVIICRGTLRTCCNTLIINSQTHHCAQNNTPGWPKLRGAINTFDFYLPIWIKFGTRRVHTMLWRIRVFCEYRRRETCTPLCRYMKLQLRLCRERYDTLKVKNAV